MPNKCTGCGHVYDNYAVELIKGCQCGSSIFIYQRVTTADGRRPEPQQSKQTRPRQTPTASRGASPGPAAVNPREVAQKVQTAVEQFQDSGEPVSVDGVDVEFDMESIRVIEEGVYDINIKKLMQKEPLIVEIKEDGKYFVHLASIFKKTMDMEYEALELKKRK